MFRPLKYLVPGWAVDECNGATFDMSKKPSKLYPEGYDGTLSSQLSGPLSVDSTRIPSDEMPIAS